MPTLSRSRRKRRRLLLRDEAARGAAHHHCGEGGEYSSAVMAIEHILNSRQAHNSRAVGRTRSRTCDSNLLCFTMAPYRFGVSTTYRPQVMSLAGDQNGLDCHHCLSDAVTAVHTTSSTQMHSPLNCRWSSLSQIRATFDGVRNVCIGEGGEKCAIGSVAAEVKVADEKAAAEAAAQTWLFVGIGERAADTSALGAVASTPLDLRSSAITRRGVGSEKYSGYVSELVHQRVVTSLRPESLTSSCPSDASSTAIQNTKRVVPAQEWPSSWASSLWSASSSCARGAPCRRRPSQLLYALNPSRVIHRAKHG